MTIELATFENPLPAGDLTEEWDRHFGHLMESGDAWEVLPRGPHFVVPRGMPPVAHITVMPDGSGIFRPLAQDGYVPGESGWLPALQGLEPLRLGRDDWHLLPVYSAPMVMTERDLGEISLVGAVRWVPDGPAAV
jgi:hypothetical protein